MGTCDLIQCGTTADPRFHVDCSGADFFCCSEECLDAWRDDQTGAEFSPEEVLQLQAEDYDTQGGWAFTWGAGL